MTRTSLILLSHLCLLVDAGLAQSRPTESRPVRGGRDVAAAGVPRPEVTEPPGDQIFRMGLAAPSATSTSPMRRRIRRKRPSTCGSTKTKSARSQPS